MESDINSIQIEVLPKGYSAGDLTGGPTFESLGGRIGELGDSIASMAEELRARFSRAAAAKPSEGLALQEVSVKFSLDLQGEAGIIISRVSTKAGFEVSLTWKGQA